MCSWRINLVTKSSLLEWSVRKCIWRVFFSRGLGLIVSSSIMPWHNYLPAWAEIWVRNIGPTPRETGVSKCLQTWYFSNFTLLKIRLLYKIYRIFLNPIFVRPTHTSLSPVSTKLRKRDIGFPFVRSNGISIKDMYRSQMGKNGPKIWTSPYC